MDVLTALGGPAPRPGPPTARPTVGLADAVGDRGALAEWRDLRRLWFCDRFGLFPRHDGDEHDDDPATRVLLARGPRGEVLGGVRVHPVGDPAALAWWRGGRLVTADAAPRGTGSALVRAACALAESLPALRFDATVLPATAAFFRWLGWQAAGPVDVAGQRHELMRWPLTGCGDQATAAKAALGPLLGDLAPGGAGWLGDDAAPVPGGDAVASVDAVLPAMVAHDPEWAGWCGMLVGANDLAAMGAAPSGALTALACGGAGHAARALDGLRAASAAFDLPILGGHTQLGEAEALSVTALGRAAEPVPGGGGVPGDELRLTVDLAGGWRPGYEGRQWDSTTTRRRHELAAMLASVGRAVPRAAKDVSMAGVLGTAGMLAEASGCGVDVDVAALPRPAGAEMGAWVRCFPGFGMLTADRPGAHPPPAAPATSAVCGRLREGAGVTLVWPDGEHTPVLAGGVTGMGPADAIAWRDPDDTRDDPEDRNGP